jgi:hypothetical protein
MSGLIASLATFRQIGALLAAEGIEAGIRKLKNHRPNLKR